MDKELKDTNHENDVWTLSILKYTVRETYKKNETYTIKQTTRHLIRITKGGERDKGGKVYLMK